MEREISDRWDRFATCKHWSGHWEL
jgi:hypothetical protein